jgi:hypothetical protein
MKKIFIFIIGLIGFQNAFAFSGLGNVFQKSSTTNSVVKSFQMNNNYQTFSNYSVSTTIENGTTIKEFINNSGLVFAVNWSGQMMPDIKALLGQYQPNSQNHSMGGLHSSLYKDANLVIYKTGNMRLNQGVAYVKDLIPTSFDLNNLKP